MGFLKHFWYLGSVEYDDESGVLYGKVQFIHGTLISYEGKTLQELKENFKRSVDDYLNLCFRNGVRPVMPYSGRLNLRISTELHAAIAEAALTEGVSLNEFVKNAISKLLGFQN